MRPVLRRLHRLGALVPRGGQGIATVVDKQHRQRGFRLADGEKVCFKSFWETADESSLIEYAE